MRIGPDPSSDQFPSLSPFQTHEMRPSRLRDLVEPSLAWLVRLRGLLYACERCTVCTKVDYCMYGSASEERRRRHGTTLHEGRTKASRKKEHKSTRRVCRRDQTPRYVRTTCNETHLVSPHSTQRSRQTILQVPTGRHASSPPWRPTYQHDVVKIIPLSPTGFLYRSPPPYSMGVMRQGERDQPECP